VAGGARAGLPDPVHSRRALGLPSARDAAGDERQAAKVLSWMHLLTMMATLVAPMIGTWLVLIDGWRTIFAALFILCGMVNPEQPG
jgi:MFS family permease